MFCSNGSQTLLCKATASSRLEAGAIQNDFENENFTLGAEIKLDRDVWITMFLSESGILKFYKEYQLVPFHTSTLTLIRRSIGVAADKEKFYLLDSCGSLAIINAENVHSIQELKLKLESEAVCIAISNENIYIGLVNGSVQEFLLSDLQMDNGGNDLVESGLNSQSTPDIASKLSSLAILYQLTMTSIAVDRKTSTLVVGYLHGGLYAIIHALDTEVVLSKTKNKKKRNKCKTAILVSESVAKLFLLTISEGFLPCFCSGIGILEWTEDSVTVFAFRMKFNFTADFNIEKGTWSGVLNRPNDIIKFNITANCYRPATRRTVIDNSYITYVNDKLTMHICAHNIEDITIPMNELPLFWNIVESPDSYIRGTDCSVVTMVFGGCRVRIYHVLRSKTQGFICNKINMYEVKMYEFSDLWIGIEEVCTSSMRVGLEFVSMLSSDGHLRVFRISTDNPNSKPNPETVCENLKISETIRAAKSMEISKTEQSMMQLWVLSLSSGMITSCLVTPSIITDPVVLYTPTEVRGAKQMELFRIDQNKYNCMVLHGDGTLLSLRIKIDGITIISHQKKEVVASVPWASAFCKIHPEREHYAVAGQGLEIVKFY